MKNVLGSLKKKRKRKEKRVRYVPLYQLEVFEVIFYNMRKNSVISIYQA